MTLSAPHYWTGGRVVHNAAPRPADGTAQLRRIAHDDGSRSTLVEIAGVYPTRPAVPPGCACRSTIAARTPCTARCAIGLAAPIRGDRAYSTRSSAWMCAARCAGPPWCIRLRARPDRCAALADFAWCRRRVAV
ncbi:MAG: hypothetical protein R2851_27905 [Caldilineaceae bacterium]